MRQSMVDGSFQLHIIIYSELLEYGGGRETWLAYFMPFVAKTGRFNNIHVYHLASREPDRSLPRKLDIEGLPISFIPVDIGKPEESNPVKNVSQFTSVVSSNLKRHAKGGDIVLLIGTLTEAVAGLASKIRLSKSIHMVTWVRSIMLGEIATWRAAPYVRLASFIENIIFKASEKIITNGYDTLTYYKERYPNHKDKMTVVPNAVAFDNYSYLPLPDLSSKLLRIGFIGRMTKAKGFDEFLESIRQYQSLFGYGKIQFDIWGYDSFDGLSLPEETTYHGSANPEEMPEVLAKCHAVVILNQSERMAAGGLSHGLLEAMASGRLIIAWKNPSHTQVLNRGNAFLVQEGNVAELVETYDKMVLGNRDPLIIMASNARKEAEKYSIEAHVNRFVEVLDALR